MAFLPGNKLGGKKKGSVSKKSEELRALIDKSLGKTLPESILDDLQEISSPKDRANIKIDLMPYLYPKRIPMEVKDDEDQGIGDTEVEQLYAQCIQLEKK